MIKIKRIVKMVIITIYAYCSAWITPYLWRLALGIRKGIQNDVEGEMFIVPAIFLLFTFFVIDCFIIYYVIKRANKTKQLKAIIILIFVVSKFIGFIVLYRDIINLIKDIIYLLTR
ncbi:MAG: hypothetical protein IKU82_03445 [Clostridia bacterium]|nr:hypothetical protein [Clostridia bacterium]